MSLTVTPQFVEPLVQTQDENPKAKSEESTTSMDGARRAAPSINFISALSPLDLTQLAGDDAFAVGDVAYIHAAVSGGKIGYVFGINHAKTGDKDGDHAITLRGIVTQAEDQTLRLSYEFDTPLAQTLHEGAETPLTIQLRVAQSGAARFISIDGGGA
ncbi:MAG: hypothetical protein ACPGVT_02120 [Maricaulaceae bacterium]